MYRKLQPKDSLRVLAYHTVSDKIIFDQQIKYLQKSYSIIDINCLHSFLFTEEKLPPNPLLITFDDGDISVLEKGMPVLRANSAPSVLFVITDLINSSKTFWCRWVEKDFELKGKSYPEARQMVNSLKQVPEKDRREYLNKLSKIESKQLSTANLKLLEENLFYIGNHTHTHPMVNMCSEEELREEMHNSLKCFDSWGLEGYKIFAYPNGNWDTQSEIILKEEGIKMAFLFDHKVNKGKINPLRISRIRVDADCELNEFKTKVSGLHSDFMAMKNNLKL